MNEGDGDDGCQSSEENTLKEQLHFCLSNDSGSGNSSGSESWSWHDEAEGGEEHTKSWTFGLCVVNIFERVIEVHEQLSVRVSGGLCQYGGLSG
jgi:hypothetical protein